MAGPKLTKNQARRLKKKEDKKKKVEEAANTSNAKTDDAPDHEPNSVAGPNDVGKPTTTSASTLSQDADVRPISDSLTKDLFTHDPAFAAYKDILARFGSSLDGDEVAKEANAGHQGTVFFDEDDDIPDEDDENSKTSRSRLSKKKRKQLKTLSVAELKAMVRRPEVVEWHDVSSSDPRLLVQIKAQRNIVPVPSHWSLKREYLSSKRGIEKPAFRLPKFIADTGITEMRDAVLEKEADQSLKQKQRARVQPKMGKLDIDYQKLYDAFFRFQTKPELTRYGEVYYEGKEAEVDYQHFRPGELSDATKEALGMPPGAPPPWLINQQRFGPPPSYPTLKIPGLNVPPPPGGSWGYHPGGWGKPPVDELNRPLYGGDVFGLNSTTATAPSQARPGPADISLGVGDPVDRVLWGELQPREAESEGDDSDDEDDEEGDESDQEEDGEGVGGDVDVDVSGRIQNIRGLETPGGYASVVPSQQGIETSTGEMNLRKEVLGTDSVADGASRSAYTVLPEKKASLKDGSFFGTGHLYSLDGAQASSLPVLGADEESRKRKKPGDVDVALDPDALADSGAISKDSLRQKFDEGRKQEGVGANWRHDEDLADMIAEESRKRQKTEKERAERRREGRSRN